MYALALCLLFGAEVDFRLEKPEPQFHLEAGTEVSFRLEKREVRKSKLRLYLLVTEGCGGCKQVKRIILDPKQVHQDWHRESYIVVCRDESFARLAGVTAYPAFVMVRETDSGVEILEVVKEWTTAKRMVDQAISVFYKHAGKREARVAVRKAEHYGYPVGGNHWSYPGNSRADLINHLMEGGLHAGKFSLEWLRTQSYASLLSLHSADHDRRVLWGYVK